MCFINNHCGILVTIITLKLRLHNFPAKYSKIQYNIKELKIKIDLLS